ncbi:MAG: cytochrome c oxidase subunit 4 [Propioniciclava sp.]
MKTEAFIFLLLAIFFGAVTPGYAIVTWWLDGQVEPIGTTVLALTTLFSAMIWGALALTAKTIGPRPEDRKDAEVVEGAGVLGFFPSRSLVPFWTTLALAIMLLGVVFGWWLTILGALVGVWTAFGWAYEYYVGDYKH